MPPVSFGWGGWITPVLRDQIPGDWEVPPLVPGQQIAALDAPGRSFTWRVWVGGDHPPPAHPVVQDLHRRSLPHPEKLLVFGVTASLGCPLEVQTQTVLDLDPRVVVEHLIEVARAWETTHRPERPWTTRGEERDAIQREAQAALRRQMEEARRKREAEEEEKEKAKVAKRKAGWTVRRGHHVPG